MTDCDHVWTHAASGNPLPPADPSHLQQCVECRRLAAAEAWMARRTRKRVSLGPALRAAIAADPGPVTPRTPLRRAVPSIVVALMAIAATALLAPLRRDLGGIVACALLALLAALGIGLVFHRGADGLGPSLKARWTYVVVAILLFGLVGVGAPDGIRTPTTTHSIATMHVVLPQISALMSQGWPGPVSHASEGRHGPLSAGSCASYGMVLTLLMGSTLLVGARRTVPVSPEATGACVGIAAGLVSATALGMHTAGGGMHMMVAHGLPLLLGLLLGVGVGRRMLAP